MPEISVIMGVYNQLNRDELFSSVESILNQTFQDFEFIIYDDGSKPEATKMLKEVEKLDSRIVLIGKDKNHGLAFSLNECIKVAQGKYIARMDADDISYPTRFEKQLEYLEQNPDISWVGCNMELFDDNGVWGKRNHPEFPTEKDFLAHSPYPHPTVIYRAEIFDKYKGYNSSDENLRCEDYELFMRLTKEGLKGANLQEYLFCYREDMNTYNRRNKTARINEMKCRYCGFKEMGILFPFGWVYMLRPIAALIIPPKFLAWNKRIISTFLTSFIFVVVLTQFSGCATTTDKQKVEGNIDNISHYISGYSELKEIAVVDANLSTQNMKANTNVIVRSGANLDAAKIGELGKGDTVKAIKLSEDQNYYEIIFNGRIAYVDSNTLDSISQGQNAQDNQRPQPTTTTTRNATPKKEETTKASPQKQEEITETPTQKQEEPTEAPTQKQEEPTETPTQEETPTENTQPTEDPT